jgi:8-oxo-dGTP pyrophosphatase MutT (NUDIX family)
VRLAVGRLTADAPFRAGVMLLHRGRLVLTLDHDDLPSELVGRAVRVKWVGGGQEPRENVWECALREAHEEVAAAVDLVPSPVTYFHDAEEGEPRLVDCDDDTAPLLVERISRPSPDVTDGPELPAGPYLYAVTFPALTGDAADLRPGAELVGLLLLPLELWSLVERGARVEDAVDAGAEVVGGDSVPGGATLWVHPLATLRVAVPLLAEPAVAESLRLPK